jgi:hypothetical protein
MKWHQYLKFGIDSPRTLFAIGSTRESGAASGRNRMEGQGKQSWPTDEKSLTKVDPPRASAPADESFHAVKGKYTDKSLNFTTSTEARFALEVVSQPGTQTRNMSHADL